MCFPKKKTGSWKNVQKKKTAENKGELVRQKRTGFSVLNSEKQLFEDVGTNFLSSHCFCLSLSQYPLILAESSTYTWHAFLLDRLDVVPKNCCKESWPHHNVATPRVSSSPLKSAQFYPHNPWEACKYSKKVQNIPGDQVFPLGRWKTRRNNQQTCSFCCCFFFERARKKWIFWGGTGSGTFLGLSWVSVAHKNETRLVRNWVLETQMLRLKQLGSKMSTKIYLPTVTFFFVGKEKKTPHGGGPMTKWSSQTSGDHQLGWSTQISKKKNKWRFGKDKNQQEKYLSFNSSKNLRGIIFPHIIFPHPDFRSFFVGGFLKKMHTQNFHQTECRFGVSRGRWRSGHLGRNDVQKAWHGLGFQVGPKEKNGNWKHQRGLPCHPLKQS